jgi:hypothetical protein
MGRKALVELLAPRAAHTRLMTDSPLRVLEDTWCDHRQTVAQNALLQRCASGGRTNHPAAGDTCTDGVGDAAEHLHCSVGPGLER